MYGMFRVWFRDHDLEVMIADLVGRYVSMSGFV